MTTGAKSKPHALPLAVVVACLLIAGGLVYYAVQELSASIEGPGTAQAAPRAGSLHAAAAAGDTESLRRALADPLAAALVSQPLDASEPARAGMTPLMCAAMGGHAEALALLLDAGARPNESTPDGRTALYFAAGWGDAAAVRRLLDAGARVDARTTDNWTALMIAAGRGEPAALAELLAAGANVDARNKWGQTALMLAVIAGEEDKAAALVRAGASVSAADAEGLTAAAIAAAGPSPPSLLAALIAGGADIDAPDADGVTPLMKAADRGDLEKIVLLLDAGADPAAIDKAGRTALDWALARDDDLGRQAAAALSEALGR